MIEKPKDIQARTAEQLLVITWPNDHVSKFPFVFLRGECPCAVCVDEMTGKRILDLSTIPANLTIKDMQLVGHYAVKIVWSDDHDTGLFTWQNLSVLCPCPKCSTD